MIGSQLDGWTYQMGAWEWYGNNAQCGDCPNLENISSSATSFLISLDGSGGPPFEKAKTGKLKKTTHMKVSHMFCGRPASVFLWTFTFLGLALGL